MSLIRLVRRWSPFWRRPNLLAVDYRKIHLTSHLSEAELKQCYRSNKDPIESRRFHLLWLVSQGNTLTQAATVVGLNYDYASRVVKRYNEQGREGIRALQMRERM